MVDGNRLGAVGFEKLGTPYKKMDCQAFIEWCLRKCGMNKDLAGSNAWYREVKRNGVILTPEECVRQLGRVPAGAFLFILKQDGGEPAKYKPDGLGNADHIGIVTGRGEGAIHSSASRGCVAESSFKGKTISGGWNRVGLWNQVEYDYTGGAEQGTTEQWDGSDRSADAEPQSRPSRSDAVPEYAVVQSANGNPVNTRQGPGKGYGLSKAGKLPVGTAVEILKRRDGWCRIRVTDSRNAVWYCWMMEEFLQPLETTEQGDGFARSADAELQNCPRRSDVGLEEPLWRVTVPYLTASEAKLLAESYPGAITERMSDAV